MDEYYRRLPLAGLRNARELGGYPLPEGGATKFRRFVRCEIPRLLTEADLEFLREYGVRTSVDFRGDRELSRIPNQLKDVPWIKYQHSPTFNEQVAFPGRDRRVTDVNAFVCWGEKYTEMLIHCRDWVRRTLSIMAHSDGVIMYNCTTGKDRTGIISALLLGLAGVAGEDIIADYCVSQVYLHEVYTELAHTMPAAHADGAVDLADPFFRTEPGNMAAMLAYIEKEFGTVSDYVRACGVSDGDAAELKKRLTEDR